jgi:type I restriction enzyme R subunit
VVIEAEEMDYHANGRQEDDYWLLWANGAMREEVYFPATGEYRFAVIAKGDLAYEVGPQMGLLIDGVLVGEAVFNKAKLIIKLGNNAVHKENKVPVNDGITAVKEFFHIAYWLVHTYGRTTKLEPGLTFDIDAIPKTAAVSQKTVAQLQKLGTELKEKDEKLSVLLADKNTLDETIKQLRAELASVKQANTSKPDTHDYSEQQTRDIFIDLLLKEAGWILVSTSLNQRERSLSELVLSVVEVVELVPYLKFNLQL